MIKARINALRALMHKKDIAIYIITSSDYNASAYVGEHFKTRAFFSGFTGSNGTLIVSENEAALYTDSRYFLQAQSQLEGSGIELYRMGETQTPDICDFITNKTPYGGIAAGDGRTFSADFASKLSTQLSKKHARLCCEYDLAGEIWGEKRPPLPNEPVEIHELEYAGESAVEKLSYIREEMKKIGADLHLMAALDDIAWLLNIRGNDIHCLPAVLSFAIISDTGVTLFADERKFDSNVKQYLNALGVTLAPYDSVYEYPKNYNGNAKTLMLSRKTVNYRLCAAASQRFEIIDRPNPATLKKAVKNDTEIANLKKVMIRDGAALTEFIYYLKTNVGRMDITEMDAIDVLASYRLRAGACGNSFNTICAYAQNAALVHYSAAFNTNKPLLKRGLLLVDSGGQYRGGTTDVTRTVALGETTDLEKKCYTLVLKGMLELASVRFKNGLTGANLDVLARIPLWEHGFDYGHATGHGVGSYLGVHEYPNGFSIQNECVQKAGMVTTDEPGVYIEGKFGIRIENELLCVDDGDGFLRFEILTMAPIDTSAIDFSLMSDTDRVRLNEYHSAVRKNIAPLLSDGARSWLMEAAKDI